MSCFPRIEYRNQVIPCPSYGVVECWLYVECVILVGRPGQTAYGTGGATQHQLDRRFPQSLQSTPMKAPPIVVSLFSTLPTQSRNPQTRTGSTRFITSGLEVMGVTRGLKTHNHSVHVKGGWIGSEESCKWRQRRVRLHHRDI